jgi:hypothetical protein
MAVWYLQSADGEQSGPHVIAPHFAEQTDAELLAVKAKGASDKGWAVAWTGERSFTATKERWGGVLCTREFWTD